MSTEKEEDRFTGKDNRASKMTFSSPTALLVQKKLHATSGMTSSSKLNCKVAPESEGTFYSLDVLSTVLTVKDLSRNVVRQKVKQAP